MIVVYGPSGGGKSRITVELAKMGYTLSIGYTTRKPRVGEVNGVHYHFISKDDFRKKIMEGFFLEWAPVGDEFYGTSMGDTGDNILKIVEPNGLRQLMSKVDVVAVYINTPESIRQERMASRGDSEDFIASRNLVDKGLFDEGVQDLAHIIFNNDTEFSPYKVERLHEVIQVAQDMMRSHTAIPKIQI